MSTTIGCASAQAFEKGQAPEPKNESYITMQTEGQNIIESTDSLDVIHRDKQFTWGIEYVPKEKEGKKFLAQRYVKINNKTGEAIILGEFDNIFQVAEDASKIPDLPEVIKQYAQREKLVLEQFKKQEADLLERGWLELPDGKHGINVPGSERIVAGKKIHTEVRRVYDEKGFDVITIWEIDEEGNEVGYTTTSKGESEYDKYLKIIESAKTKK